MAINVSRTAPPAIPTGFTATAIHGWEKCYNEESGNLIDRTTEFTTIGTDVESFAADDDYVYFSVEVIYQDSRVTHIHIDLSQVASESIQPVFEYSTGDDSWDTINVTDGTNGFTQDGSITIDLSTFPNTSNWKVATKDGSGNTIGDGTARRYLRIRRTADTLTTPPKISECGTGFLTASKTYYYKIAGSEYASVTGTTGNSNRLSEPSSEISATTTTIKRTIKLEFDTGGTRYIVWRTPTSGDYGKTAVSNGGARTATAYIDSECQTVNGRYFFEACGTGGADSYLIDRGLADGATYYSAANELWVYYRETLYTGKERGDLVVTTTDGEHANFYKIWLECQSNGWDTALERLHFGLSPDTHQRHKIYRLNDNLDIQDYFTDTGVTLYMTAVLTTYNCTAATFGRRLGSSPNYYYDTGVNFVLAQGITFDGKFYFKNTNFYSCKFVQASINEQRIYSHFPRIHDDCKLYDCMLDGYASMEKPTFEGDNIILKNVVISVTRYGLDVTPTALETINMEDVTIQGGTGIYNGSPYWQDGANLTFKGFTFKNCIPFLKSYSATSNDSNVTLNFVNPIFENSSIDTSWGGQNWIYNEQYTFDLKLLNEQGNPIENATVKIVDTEGSTVATITTDASGDIAQQTITYKQYTGGTLKSSGYHQYLADDVTTLTPHTVTISKSGYLTKKVKYTLTTKTTEIETLEKMKDLNFSDNIMLRTQ